MLKWTLKSRREISSSRKENSACAENIWKEVRVVSTIIYQIPFCAAIFLIKNPWNSSEKTYFNAFTKNLSDHRIFYSLFVSKFCSLMYNEMLSVYAGILRNLTRHYRYLTMGLWRIDGERLSHNLITFYATWNSSTSYIYQERGNLRAKRVWVHIFDFWERKINFLN